MRYQSSNKEASSAPEASPLLPDKTVSRRRQWSLSWRLPVALGAIFLLYALVRSPISRAKTGFEPSSPWDSVHASKDLEFQSCYNGYKCSKLVLPLDWWNGTHPDETIELAVSMLPAPVPITHPQYGGSILVNPGGPGGSGASFVIVTGSSLQKIVQGHEEGDWKPKFYDIVGFDPRGIGNTSPGAHCWESASARQSWTLRILSEGLLDSSDAALGRLWSMSEALGSSCAANAVNSDIKRFITTSSVARDMLELTEKLGAWREREAKRITKDPRKIEALKYRPGEEKLQYWGFSYGTYLGNTFASMFPDRVGRVILDGVVNADNYAHNFWSDNLHDTEKVLQIFYDRCAQAGPNGCPLARDGSNASDIKKKTESIVSSLYHNPLPVTGYLPEIITYSDIKKIIFSILYTPRLGFPVLAHFLDSIEKRDGETLAQVLALQHVCGCSLGCERDAAPLTGEAQTAILCSDGDPQDYMNSTLFRQYIEDLNSHSPSFGALWAQIRLQCTRWKFRPLHRFAGPFGANTSNPILFIGNTADPVTPLISAHKMSALFPGSSVLTQDSPGHCSLAAPSPCTFNAIQAYLKDGILPKEGTVCQETSKPNELNVELYEAHQKISDAFTENHFGLGKNLIGIPDRFVINMLDAASVEVANFWK